MMTTETLAPFSGERVRPNYDVPPVDWPPVAANDNWPRVVALAGAAGVGKSTVANHLVQEHGYTLVKFAGPLKDMARAVGLTDAHIEGNLKEVPCELLQGKTPRYFMQRLGTELGRDMIGPNFWTDLWKRSVEDVLNFGGRVVCDDCRFENEAAVVREMGGRVVRLVGRGGLAGEHASEAGCAADMEIRNAGQIETTL